MIRRRQLLQAPGEARSELQIIADLAARLGAPSSFPTEPQAVFAELAAASAGGIADYSGIDYRLLDQAQPVHWPYGAGQESTPRLFTDRFGTADGLANLVPVRSTRPADPPATGRQLTMITGRLLEHYQSGAQTRRVPELADSSSRAWLQIHPVTAVDHGIADGDRVEVRSERGTVRVRARLSTAIRPDTIFLPFHFAGSETANRVTPAATDPISGMPEFKSSRVTIVGRGDDDG